MCGVELVDNDYVILYNPDASYCYEETFNVYRIRIVEEELNLYNYNGQNIRRISKSNLTISVPEEFVEVKSMFKINLETKRISTYRKRVLKPGFFDTCLESMVDV